MLAQIHSAFHAMSPVFLGISAVISTTVAEEPVRQNFGAWTVTIQPGVRGSAITDRGSPTGSLPMRLVSQTTETPAVPPEPTIPEPTAIPTEAGSAAAAPNCRTVDSLALVRLYSQVYNTIPFSRAEFEANPSYRHDATMEFLFGQMRPTVIQRGTTVIQNRNTSTPSGYGMPYSPYGFNSYYYPFYDNYHTGIYRTYDLW